NAAVPAWIDAAVTRGLSADPTRRFPSMDALLARLADDPRVRRRRRLAAAIGVTVFAGLVAAAWPRAEVPVDPCAGMGAELAPIWNDDRRRALGERFVASELRYAESSAITVSNALDDFSRGWVGAREQACRDHAEGRQSDALFDRRMSCLDGRVDQLRATVEVLLEADAKQVERAAELVAGLPELAACSDAEALAEEFPLPEDPELRRRHDEARRVLAQAQVLTRADRYQEGLDILQTLDPEVVAIAHPPLIADHGLVKGTALLQLGRYEAAVETLETVYVEAVVHHLPHPAAVATVTIMNALGTHLHRAEDSASWALHAEAWTRADGSPLMRAAHETTLANLERSVGHYDAAIAGFREGIAIIEADQGPNSPQLRFALTNLGATYMHTDRFAEAVDTYARLQQLYEHLYGVHPKLALALRGRADAEWRMGLFEPAREHLHRSLEITQETLGADSIACAQVLVSLGRLEEEHGDLDSASERYREALKVFERSGRPLDLMPPLNNLGEIARKRGRFDEAREYYQKALDIAADA
ncbi:MAG: tetratricopeptide repeat protein, partial [Myxococcales bacterium]|nr:tetratricopeptide repeat protein [Myxococcales bacterium]